VGPPYSLGTKTLAPAALEASATVTCASMAVKVMVEMTTCTPASAFVSADTSPKSAGAMRAPREARVLFCSLSTEACV
jgi:hypothetical protein